MATTSTAAAAGAGARTRTVWVDACANLANVQFEPDRDTVVDAAVAAGLAGFVIPASSAADAAQIVELGKALEEAHPAVWVASPCGVHPWAVCPDMLAVDSPTSDPHAHAAGCVTGPNAEDAALDPGLVAVFEDLLAQQSGPAWVGEIGLDYCDACPVDHGVQGRVFRAQLSWARASGRPVYLHCRDAWDDFFRILADYPGPGLLHCFTGSAQDAARALDMGLVLGVTGMVVGKSKPARALRSVLKDAVPLDKLVLETDAPYLLPRAKGMSKRAAGGRRNEPKFLLDIGAAVADIYGVSIDVVAASTTQLACDLFAPRSRTS